MPDIFAGNTSLLIVGIISSFGYLIRYVVIHGTADFEKAVGNTVIIFPAGASIIGGLKIMLLSFDTKVCDVNQIEQVYICLGGLAVLVASGFDVYRKIKDA